MVPSIAPFWKNMRTKQIRVGARDLDGAVLHLARSASQDPFTKACNYMLSNTDSPELFWKSSAINCAHLLPRVKIVHLCFGLPTWCKLLKMIRSVKMKKKKKNSKKTLHNNPVVKQHMRCHKRKRTTSGRHLNGPWKGGHFNFTFGGSRPEERGLAGQRLPPRHLQTKSSRF